MFDRNAQIHPTAQVAPGVALGDELIVGPFAVLESGVVLAAGVQIGAHAVIEAGAILEQNVIVDHHAVVRAATKLGAGTVVGAFAVAGQRPARARSSTLEVSCDLPPLETGPYCHLGVGAVVYAGARLAAGCFIADSAQVREGCVLGQNVIVGRGTTIENDCQVGEGTRLQTGAYLTAHSSLAENVFIAPMVTTTNDNFIGRTQERFRHRRGVTIGKGGRVAGGATILPGVTVGQESVVAAGSVVTHDVPAYTVVMGVPARVTRTVAVEQLIYLPDAAGPRKEE